MGELADKCCKCEPYEVGFIAECKDRSNCLYGDGTDMQWDDKFGLIETGKDYMTENIKVIDGVGKDAEIVTNADGGKQSKSPMAMHLVAPSFLKKVYLDKAERLENFGSIDTDDMEAHSNYMAMVNIADFMLTGDGFYIFNAMDYLAEENEQIIKIAKVLQYGADRYEPNNWRLIPQEEHINHALIHILAHIAGDTQDNHIDHALCRLMMVYSTKKSEGFDYSNYVKKTS
jgi:hypothetical protein